MGEIKATGKQILTIKRRVQGKREDCSMWKRSSMIWNLIKINNTPHEFIECV